LPGINGANILVLLGTPLQIFLDDIEKLIGYTGMKIYYIKYIKFLYSIVIKYYMSVLISKTQHIPIRYAPAKLSDKDRKKQLASLRKSRKLYKKGIYYKRPNIGSFKTRKSRHLSHAKKLYGVPDLAITPQLAKNTKCSIKTLKKIVNKGEGAYYSSGSRPSQTAQSWGYARLASALTGGNSSIVDFHLLKEGCSPNSLPLRLARKTCRKQGRNCANK
jgi:Family of unknown function (DUF5824)